MDLTRLFSAKSKPEPIPARISQYRILKKLGQGGMGQVYLAEDATLNRKVAIKIITGDRAGDAKARKRLITEAKAVAQLDHPNICHVYSAGEEESVGFFMAMQYLEGETLSARCRNSPLPWRTVLELAVPLADALAEAHAHGVIHRDVKPANIIITPQGQPKLTDFGLAQALSGPPGGQGALVSRDTLTETGTIAGSPPYMSPEQLRAEKLDGQTDIFSYGCVLYEAVSGKHPFMGDNVMQIITAVLTREPVPLAQHTPGIPPELSRIVARCLAKERGQRYLSFRDVLADLRRLLAQISSGSVDSSLVPQRQAPAPRPDAIDSIAVLPFVNSSGNPEIEYLVDGLTENIIGRLSRLRGLKVMARSTVSRFRNRDADAQAAGRELNTRAVALGRVKLVGGRLVVGMELVDVRDGSLLWSERYDREFADILAIEEEISSEIVAKLQVRLGRREMKQLAKRDTANSEAYQLYLKGQYHWVRREGDDLYKAIEYFEAASRKDPEYALAHTGVANSYAILAFVNFLPPTEAMPKAKAAVRHALELDAELGEAFATLGWIRFAYDWDWVGAESAFVRALELAPQYPIAHFWYAHYLQSMGQPARAFETMQAAVDLEPDSPLITGTLAWVYMLGHRIDDALAQAEKSLELDPAFPRTHWVLGQVFEQLGRYEEAIASFRKARSLSAGSLSYLACLGHACALAGKHTEARDVLRQMEQVKSERYVSSFDIAEIYAALGETDQAFRWLDRAMEERPKYLADLAIRPTLDVLRGDPRFARLMQRVGLLPDSGEARSR